MSLCVALADMLLYYQQHTFNMTHSKIHQPAAMDTQLRNKY